MLTLRDEAKLGKAVCGALVTFQNLNITQIWHSLQYPATSMRICYTPH